MEVRKGKGREGNLPTKLTRTDNQSQLNKENKITQRKKRNTKKYISLKIVSVAISKFWIQFADGFSLLLFGY